MASTIGFVVSYYVGPHCYYIIKSRLAISSPDEFLVGIVDGKNKVGRPHREWVDDVVDLCLRVDGLKI